MKRALTIAAALFLVQACGTSSDSVEVTPDGMTDVEDMRADGAGLDVLPLDGPLDIASDTDGIMPPLDVHDVDDIPHLDGLDQLDSLDVEVSLCPNDCDDGDECTLDICDPELGCQHEPIEGCCPGQTVLATGFDGEEPMAGFTTEVTVPVYSDNPDLEPMDWNVGTARFHSGPAALHFGNPDSLSYYNGHRVASDFVIPGLALEEGFDQALDFWLYLDIEEGLYSDYVSVYVRTDGVRIPVWGKGEYVFFGEWFPVQVDLSPFAGKSVDIVFSFDSWDEKENEGEGVWLDDIVVSKSCEAPEPCDTDLDCHVSWPCAAGTCAEGTCLWEYSTECCILPANCEDWDGCTIEKCADSVCVWQDDPDPLCCNSNDECQDEDELCTVDVCKNNYCTFLPSGAEGCCQNDIDCNDSDDCTTDLCIDLACVHINTCCVTDEDCDDGDDKCTTDICYNGTCVFMPSGEEGCCATELLDEGFESGDAPNWSFTSTAMGEIEWTVSAVDAYTGAMSLGLVAENIDGGGTARAVLPIDTMPPVGGELTFYLRTHFQESGDCGENKISVTFEGEELVSYCTSIINWFKVEVPLDSIAGETGELAIRVDLDPWNTYDPNLYSVYVDKVELTQGCCSSDSECDDGDFCTEDLCPGLNSFCQFVPIDGCCHNDYGCDDGDECTLDVCTGEHVCAHFNQCCESDADCDDEDDVCTTDFCVNNFCVFQPTGAPGCCIPEAYVDGFEAGLAGWTLDNEIDTEGWQVVDNVSNTGSSSLYYGNPQTGEYVSNKDDFATSPPIELQAGASATLRFFTLHETENCCDKVTVSVVDENQEKTQLDIFGGTAATWQEKEYDLSEFTGQTVRIEFKFHSDGSVVAQGAYIDDLFVEIGCCSDDADCDDGNICTSDSCPGEESLCINTPIENCCVANADCDDGEVCTLDQCIGNQCQHQDICCLDDAECDDGDDICTEDACVDGFCEYTYTGAEGCCQESLYLHDFELGAASLSGFEIDNESQDSYWQVTAAQAYQGTYSLAYSNASGDGYTANSTGTLITPLLFLELAAAQPQLVMEAMWDTESCCDDVTISVLHGAEETQLDVLAGSQLDWTQLSYDLTEFAGQEPVQIKFYFDSDGSIQKTGVFIDNLRIEQLCCSDDAECDDGNPCTVDSCPGTNSICSFEPIPGCCIYDVDCDDGDDCTQDTCQAGQCQHVDTCCTGDADCDDGDDVCTEDSCVDGKCVFAILPLEDCCFPIVFTDDFETGALTGWTITSDDPPDGWHLDESKAVTGEASLYYGNEEGTAYANNSEGDALSPPIAIPVAPSATLSMQIWVDTEDGFDDVRIGVVNEEGAVEQLDELNGTDPQAWQLKEYDISGYVGTTIQVLFTFDSDGSTAYTGVWIDQLRVEIGCCDTDADCDDGNICTTDSCPAANSMCVQEWLPNCCTSDADCDDGDDCTVDECLGEAGCTHTNTCCATDDECDDGDDKCTVDSCVDGACVYEFQNLPGCCQGLLFDEGFEGNLDAWTVDNDQNDYTWHIQDIEVYAGSTALGFSNAAGDSYGANSDGFVRSPGIELGSGGLNPTLSFFAKHHTESCCDWWRVGITADGQYTQLGEYKGEVADWTLYEFDLAPWANQTIQVEFTFHSDGSISYEGVAIDALRILQDCCNVDGDCDDNDLCTADSCPGANSMCLFEPIEGCCHSDADCDDGDACTYDECMPGNTCYHPPLCCDVDADCVDDDDLCTDDTCVDNVCQYDFNGNPGCCMADFYFDDFEGGDLGKYELDNQNADSFWFVTDAEFYHGSHSLAYSSADASTYSGSSYGTIITAKVDVPLFAVNPHLEFWTRYETESCCDWWKVHIVVDGQQTELEEFKGEQLDWTLKSYDLSAYAGLSIQVMFEFDSDSSVNKQGVFIDDLALVQDCCDVDGDCDDGNPCTQDSCPGEDSACQYDEIPGCCLGDADCDDGDDCTMDLCTFENTCQNVNICCTVDGDCDDGDDLCTDDACVDGVCEFTPTGADGCCNAPLFADDFSTDLGWDYGTHWERGEAIESSCGFAAYEDPATDHTGSDDNVLAGVLIGGCMPEELHDFYYLTSPVVDAAGVSPLYLSYWRWLNSDYAPYTINHVQAFDGSQWQTVWESGGSPGIEDSAWFFQELDISAHANAALQVRFGYAVEDDGMWAESSWNVDDVKIYSTSSGMCCTFDSDCQGYGTECVLGACQ